MSHNVTSTGAQRTLVPNDCCKTILRCVHENVFVTETARKLMITATQCGTTLVAVGSASLLSVFPPGVHSLLKSASTRWTLRSVEHSRSLGLRPGFKTRPHHAAWRDQSAQVAGPLLYAVQSSLKTGHSGHKFFVRVCVLSGSSFPLFMFAGSYPRQRRRQN